MVGESAETILKSFFKAFFFKKDFKGHILRVIFGEKLNSEEKNFWVRTFKQNIIFQRDVFRSGSHNRGRVGQLLEVSHFHNRKRKCSQYAWL